MNMKRIKQKIGILLCFLAPLPWGGVGGGL